MTMGWKDSAQQMTVGAMRRGWRLAAMAGLLLGSMATMQAASTVTYQGSITTVAGVTGTASYTGDGGSGRAATLNGPTAVALDQKGNLYIADTGNNVIRRLDAITGIITTVAGNGTACAKNTNTCGDGGAATSANLNGPMGVAVSATGEIYIADTNDNRIRKVDTAGIITTYAGTGKPTWSGDGGLATLATLNSPMGIAFQGTTLYIADNLNNRIRLIATQTVTLNASYTKDYIYTAIGDGSASYSNMQTGAGCKVNGPTSVTADAHGYILYTDMGNNMVRRIYTNQASSHYGVNTNYCTDVAGDSANHTAGSTDDTTQHQPWINGRLNGPTGVTADPEQHLWVADQQNNSIRLLTADSQGADNVYSLTTVSNSALTLGSLGEALANSGDLAGFSRATYNKPAGLVSDGLGHIYIADTGNNTIRKASMTAFDFGWQQIGSTSSSYAVSFNIVVPSGSSLTVSKADALTLGVSGLDFNLDTSKTSTCVNSYSSVTTTCTVYVNFTPQAAGLRKGAVVLYDNASPANQVATAYISGIGLGPMAGFTPTLVTAAGTGVAGFTADNMQATGSELQQPYKVAFDGNNNMYITDGGNNRIRRVDATTGLITTIAGTSSAGGSGDNGLATVATMNHPVSMAFDGAGNYYIADWSNSSLRRVDASTGVITKIYSIAEVDGLVVDGSGNWYATKHYSSTILRNGSMIAGIDGNGNYDPTYAGVARWGSMTNPSSIGLDIYGNLYIADTGQNLIRKLPLSQSWMTTFAGTGSSCSSSTATCGDGSAATSAQLNSPKDVVPDAMGNVYIADQQDNRIRMVDPSGIIKTVVGSGTVCPNGNQGCGDGATGSTALTGAAVMLQKPEAISFDNYGNFYIGDTSDQRVRMVMTSATPSFNFAKTGVGLLNNTAQQTTLDNIGVADATQGTGSANPTYLNITGTETSEDFVLSSSSSSACGAGDSLVPTSGLAPTTANTCQLAYQFQPQSSGYIYGGSLVYDNTIYGGEEVLLNGVGVGSATTTTILTQSTGSASTTPGTAVGFTATVSASATATSGTTLGKVASGTILFKDTVNGSVVSIGSASVQSDGTAVLNLSGLTAGTHSITATFTPATTGFKTSQSSALSVVVASSGSLTLNWAAPTSITYGKPLTATQLNAAATTGSTNVPGIYTYSPAAGTVLSAGTQTLTVSFVPSDTTTYGSSAYTQTVQLTVNKAPATVTTNSVSKVYGAADPTLTGSLSGFLPADGITATYSRATGETANGGPYTISATLAASTSGALSNYNVTTNYGKLTINAATPKVTWGSVFTMGYGTALSAAQLSPGVVGSDGKTALSGTWTYTAMPSTSTTPIVVTNGTVLGAGTYTLTGSFVPSNVNYNMVSASTTLVISKAILTVTAGNLSKSYGSTLTAPAYTFSGWVNTTDAAAMVGAATITMPAATKPAVGTYPIQISKGTLSSSNYSFRFVAGTLTITKASVTVTPTSATAVYGAALPTFSYTMTGFVTGGDNAYSGTPNIVMSSASSKPNAGSYTLTATVGTLSATNYSFKIGTTATLTVSKAVLTVAANPLTKVYGTANPTLTYTVSGLATGDTAAVITGTPTLATTAVTKSPVGSYPINITTTALSATNYSIAAQAGTLTVSKASLVIMPQSVTRAYGSANPTFTYTANGLVTGDTTAVLSSAPKLSTTASATTLPGTAAITANISAVTATNYSISTIAGTLTITKAPLIFTPVSVTKVYGDALPTFSYTVQGLQGTDTAASGAFTGAPTYSTTATAQSAVGSYNITMAAGTLASTRYSFSFAPGKLIITKRTATVTANDQSKTHGTANPTLSTTATTTSPAGSYPITVSMTGVSLLSSNYLLTSANGTLTVK